MRLIDMAEFKIHLTWAITTVLCCFMIFGALAWSASPTTWTLRLEMDNNTRIAVESLNQTYAQIPK